MSKSTFEQDTIQALMRPVCSKHEPCWWPDDNYRLDRPSYYLACLHCHNQVTGRIPTTPMFTLNQAELDAGATTFSYRWAE